MSVRRWRVLESVVLCTRHTTVHDRNRNPYDMFGDDGRPVDECGPDDWLNLAALTTAEEVEGY